jgi:UDP-glucuronate decarboxylase
VDDLIEGLVRMMASPQELTGPINMGNPNEITVRELAEIVLRMTGTKSKLVMKPLPQDDPRQRQPDITLAKTQLNWEPKVSLEDGLKKTILYFREALFK